MTPLNTNLLLNCMLTISFLILMWRIDDPNILITLFAFLGFLMFLVLKFILVLRDRKSKSSK
ncbi:hypothetical protein ACD591_06330 [Rufibacter glacialis]|uniref:Uncharacterized protein n=1 Tax=Rufibacter glacialis TaxID=1259555 RepID=A0A5M8QEU8_9BACT|nr:hypothetical protein [Rufibacter glacialis]KAA6433276.1 hypothetical protein FOE74_12380 [Rufibacter glacialis]GGK75936.1 hypothetical protein GCM10011405_24650 [Rufibacter glacialis]